MTKEILRFSTMGSVDDGKSTLIGRLLFDTKSIYTDQLKNEDLAYITDGLRAEREQGITIDVAYRHFVTEKRRYIIADTPGHEQYTRNMVTGSSNVNLSIILIDARKGVLTQTKRHAFIASLLKIPHLIVAVNKMDLVGYSEEVYNKIKEDFVQFSKKLNIQDIRFVPIVATDGDNVIDESINMLWYNGDTILSILENIHIASDNNLVDVRFPVQLVLRPNQDYRGYAGKVVSGIMRKDDDIIILPSKETAKIKSINTYSGEVKEAFASESVVITLDKELDISRGGMIVRSKNIPHVASNFEALIVWLGTEGLDLNRKFFIKHTTNVTKASIDEVIYTIDVNTLSRQNKKIELNDISRVSISTQTPLFFDSYDKNKATGSFILIDSITNLTVAAGMIVNKQPILKNKNNNILYEDKSYISKQEREIKLKQKGFTVWMTGLSCSGKSTIGKILERRLFDDYKQVCLLDGDNIRLGINNDLGFSLEDRSENIRRVAEIAKLLNNLGIIVIASFISPLEKDRQLAKEIIGKENFKEVFIDTPLEVCEQRDLKGLYKKARSGEIKDFTGIDSPYDIPINPYLTIKTVENTPEECAIKIIVDCF